MNECPVCHQHQFSAPWEFCPVCDWANDPVQNDNPDMTGENTITLKEARRLFKKYGTIEAEMAAIH